VICALAVFYALSVLLALALEAAVPAVRPKAPAENTPAENTPAEGPAAEETPQAEIPAAEPPAVEVAVEAAAEAGAEAAAGETPPEPAIKIETGQGGRTLPHTPAPAPEARPGLWARGRAAVLGWIDAHRAATVLIGMAAIVVLVWATLPAGVKLDQRLLEVGLALIAITLLAYCSARPGNVRRRGCAGRRGVREPVG
jgi:hypothetical protein